MKTSQLLMLLFAVSIFASCSRESQIENDGLTVDRVVITPTGECFSASLMAGQHMDAGTLLVTENPNGDTVVRYETSNGWTLDAVHLYYGDCAEIPTTGAGNPKIGHFPVNVELSVGTTTFEHTIESLDGSTFTGCLMAHAVVNNGEQQETAWAEGESFGGNSWAMYIEYSGCTN
ncbi:MAG: hypothetical protein R3359_12165 [Marinirhabdus sp.]|nr:hypothetical protein [Marinirhabdus sp.]